MLTSRFLLPRSLSSPWFLVLAIVILLVAGLSSLAGPRHDDAYWLDRVINNDKYTLFAASEAAAGRVAPVHGLTEEEIAQIPESIWKEVTTQIIRVIPPPDASGNVGLGDIATVICKGSKCDPYLKAEEKTKTVGYSPVTGYKSTVKSAMTATQTYVPVNSLTTKDNHVLAHEDFGDQVFLDLEPGGAREEIVECTTPIVDPVNLRFTPCVRGLAFYGSSVSSVSANEYTHYSGSIVQVSNVHYVYQQFLDKNLSTSTDQFVNASAVFASSTFAFGPGTAGTMCLKFRLSATTSSWPYICSNGTTLNASADGISSFPLTPTSSVASAGNGIAIAAGVISVATTTSNAGLDFTGGLLGVNEDSSKGLSYFSNALGLNASSTAFSGLTFDTTGAYGCSGTTYGCLAFTGQLHSLNLDGYVSASSTLVTSTFSSIVLGSPSGNVIIPSFSASATAANATTTLTGKFYVTDDLAKGGGNNLWSPQRDIITFSKTVADASTVTSYTHGLGVAPNRFEFLCTAANGAAQSFGFARANDTTTAVEQNFFGTDGTAKFTQDGYVIGTGDSTSCGGNSQCGSIVFISTTSTYFNVSWTKSGTGGGGTAIGCVVMIER